MPEPETIEELRQQLAAANSRAAEFKRLYESTVKFQGSAHEKKVRAKRDRDEVIAKNARLEQMNAELRQTVSRLETQLELYA